MTKVFCAIDTGDIDAAAAMAGKLAGAVEGIKLGLEFFAAQGPSGVAQVRAAAGSAELFLDLKLHDIPNTVAGAVRSVLSCGADFLTVHASGGREMMQEAVAEAGGRVKILAVTVLTALSEDDLLSVGQAVPVKDQVLRLAKLAVDAGVDGIVCSPQEISLLRAVLPKNILLVVPGIRPAGSAAGDQKRIMTPEEAAALGADYLVIGRPITEAADPVAAARRMRA